MPLGIVAFTASLCASLAFATLVLPVIRARRRARTREVTIAERPPFN